MRKPESYSLINQPPNSRVCGAACCAMAVGKTLNQVMEEYDWKEMTHTSGMARYLCRHGITLGLWFPDYADFPRPVQVDVNPSGRPAIIAVDSPNYAHADHWIFWDGQRILDPSPTDQEKYNIQEVHFLTYWPEPPWLPELDDARWWEIAAR